MLNGLRWRLVGPHRGGRVVAVAGDPVDQLTFYFGACAGGVWKSTDAGLAWQNVSDGFFGTAAVGALAVAASDHNVIYAGTGEACIRGDASHGDGAYRSDDAGASWRKVGLPDTRHIARICIHPQNPDLVYVAALGHAYGPNAERGIFRSRNGGGHWERVLFRDERTGAADLCMDPNNPRILYATLWQVQRYPWTIESGGPGSGLFKSLDGGDTWRELTGNPGLPGGLKGRVGIAISPVTPWRVWAIIEAAGDAKGLYRSDDGGDNWRMLTNDPLLTGRPFYYMRVIADPQDAQTVYVLNSEALTSTDGGSTFFQQPTYHGDNHDLWIDPADPRRRIIGNDGGASVSLNGGRSWSTIYNQPTAQFYHVTTDTRFPYRIYGAQQDNTTLCVPSRSDNGAILAAECYAVGGGESGYIAVRPDNPDIVFAGSYRLMMTRYDHRAHQTRNITVWPEESWGHGAEDLKYRFQWTFPVALSPHDPNVLYTAGNHLFRSTDEGMSWTMISPDLTRGDPATLGPSGGPLTKDNVSTEYYGTIFAFAESPLRPGLLWAGSDDGLIHMSLDGGATWSNVTPELPEWTTINIIEPSPHDAGTVYVCATRYRLDDFRPYLLKTVDCGKTWQSIAAGFPADEFTRTIREDPRRRGLLFVGTETGAYVSFDDGGRWQRLPHLPVVPVYDLVIKDDALVVATHGRSFWALDDITPLREWNEQVAGPGAFLFTPAPTYRAPAGVHPPASTALGQHRYVRTDGSGITAGIQIDPDGHPTPSLLNAGENPPDGVCVYYRLGRTPEEELVLTFRDGSGEVIRAFSSRPAAGARGLPAAQGSNRFVWDMRSPDARNAAAVPLQMYVGGGTPGPTAPPGVYEVELRLGAHVQVRRFEIRLDPRVTAGDSDMQAQFRLRIAIRDKLSETHDLVALIRSVRAQIQHWVGLTDQQPYAKQVAQAAAPVLAQLQASEETLIQPKLRVRHDGLNHPTRINGKLATLAAVVSDGDGAPTRQAQELFDDLATQIDAEAAKIRRVEAEDLPRFVAVLQEAGVPMVVTRR